MMSRKSTEENATKSKVEGAAAGSGKKKGSAPEKRSESASLQALQSRLETLDLANEMLAKELLQKRERRLTLPEIVPGESLLAMAELNLQITETESMMASQRGLINRVHGFIKSHEITVEELEGRIAEIEQRQKRTDALSAEQLKQELGSLLDELHTLRRERERLSNSQAV